MNKIVRLCGKVCAAALLLVLCAWSAMAQDFDLSPPLRGFVVEDAALFGSRYELAILLRRDGKWTDTANKVADLINPKHVRKWKKRQVWAMERLQSENRLGVSVGNGQRERETVETMTMTSLTYPQTVTKVLLDIRKADDLGSLTASASLNPLTKQATVQSIREDATGGLELTLQSPKSMVALVKAAKPLFGSITMHGKGQNGSFTSQKHFGLATIFLSVSAAPPGNKRAITLPSSKTIVTLRYQLDK